MPKLMISSASDEFFMLDDYNYFYRQLVGEKYIWFVRVIRGVQAQPRRALADQIRCGRWLWAQRVAASLTAVSGPTQPAALRGTAKN